MRSQDAPISWMWIVTRQYWRNSVPLTVLSLVPTLSHNSVCKLQSLCPIIHQPLQRIRTIFASCRSPFFALVWIRIKWHLRWLFFSGVYEWSCHTWLVFKPLLLHRQTDRHTDLGQTEAGLHADFVETLFLLQDVCQGQSGGRSWELLQCWDGLLLTQRQGQWKNRIHTLKYCT